MVAKNGALLRLASARSAAIALATLTALVHFFVGGADALAPMLDAGLTAPSEGAMHAVWHFATLLLFWSVYVFWRGGEMARHYAAIWIAMALVFIYVGLYQSGISGLLVNPQWTILGLTGALAWRATRRLPPTAA